MTSKQKVLAALVTPVTYSEIEAEPANITELAALGYTADDLIKMKAAGVI